MWFGTIGLIYVLYNMFNMKNRRDSLLYAKFLITPENGRN